MKTQNREQAKLRAQELKASGMTAIEVTEQLKVEGYKKQEPYYRGGVFYGEFTVRKWCKGIASQAGYRNPRLKTEQERKEQQRQEQAAWNKKNAQYKKAYSRWYEDNFVTGVKVYEKPYIEDYR